MLRMITSLFAYFKTTLSNNWSTWAWATVTIWCGNHHQSHCDHKLWSCPLLGCREKNRLLINIFIWETLIWKFKMNVEVDASMKRGHQTCSVCISILIIHIKLYCEAKLKVWYVNYGRDTLITSLSDQFLHTCSMFCKCEFEICNKDFH